MQKRFLQRLLFSSTNSFYYINDFRQYLRTIMVSKKVLRMGLQKISIQKTHEIYNGSSSINILFLGSNRRFDWLQISLVYEKSDKNTTIYDSYNFQ